MRLALTVAGAVIAALLGPSSADAQGLDTTCPFALTRLDSSITNTLAVDTHAVYWALPLQRGAGHAHPNRGGLSLRPLHVVEPRRQPGQADRRAQRPGAEGRPGQHEPVPPRSGPPRNAALAEATARIGEPGRERAVMGEYYPDAQYLKDEAAFEARGCPISG